MFAFGLPELIILTVVVLWVIALVDILKNKFDGSNKIIWLIVITIFPIIGVVSYYLTGRKYKKVVT